MSDHAPPGTPANNDDERTRIPNAPPGGGALPPPRDDDATIIPPTPPANPPSASGKPATPPPLPPLPPPAVWNASPVSSPSPTGLTAPYPTPQQQSPPPSQPPAYGAPPPYGGTVPLPQQPGAPPAYGGYPPDAPPYSGSYGPPPSPYPPPLTPPPKKKTGLIVGIGGGVLALLAIVGGVLLFTRKGDSPTATATPAATNVAVIASASAQGGGNVFATIAAAATGSARPGGVASTLVPSTAPTVAVAATVTAAPTRVSLNTTPTVAATGTPGASPAGAVLPTQAGNFRPTASPTVGQGGLSPAPTGSVGATGTAPALASATAGQTYTDPNGRFKMQYPRGWTATKLANSQSNIVEFDGPEGVSLYVDAYKEAGAPADEVQETQSEREKATQFAFTFSTVTDTKIGGESGKLLPYTFTRKDQPSTTPTVGLLFIVNHGGREYDFEAVNVGKHRPEIDAILATVVFTP